VPTPSASTPWRQQVVEVCRAFLTILRPHRQVLAGLPGGLGAGPQLLRMTNDIYGALGSAGFSGDDLFQGVDAIASLTIGLLFRSATDDQTSESSAEQDGTGAAPCSVREVDFSVLDAGLYPHLVAAGVRPPACDDGFDFAVDRLLDGLELRLVQAGKPTGAADIAAGEPKGPNAGSLPSGTRG
jgi:hypothetical protein